MASLMNLPRILALPLPLVLVVLVGACGSSDGASDAPDTAVTDSSSDAVADTGTSGTDSLVPPKDGEVTPDAPGSDVAAPDTAAPDTGPPAVDPCIEAGTCPIGKWIDVTPKSVDMKADLSCGNFGSESVQVDSMRPEIVYTQFNCKGVYRSNDYGMTWTGPINTGSNGATVSDCAGGVAMAPHNSGPTLYQSCIRGSGIGFWKSTNGGVDWTKYNVAPGGGRQDFYPPTFDPHDENHLLIVGHEMNVFAESTDGGATWKSVPVKKEMETSGGTSALEFIDTGVATTTAKTWLYTASMQGGKVGTWRTEDAGATWTRVDKNEKSHSLFQIYQPDATGVVYMAGLYSDLGWGVLRSKDFGKTWTHVGATTNENIVFGTKKHVYSMWGWAAGVGTDVAPTLQIADSAGVTWANATTPSAMYQGPAQASVTFDGTYSIILIANFNGGVWRYVEGP